MLSGDALLDLQRSSSKHRSAIEASEVCGCFYCKKQFPGSRVTSWVDAGQTAVCPHCAIDAVLPETAPGCPVPPEALDQMHQAYFAVDATSFGY